MKMKRSHFAHEPPCADAQRRRPRPSAISEIPPASGFSGRESLPPAIRITHSQTDHARRRGPGSSAISEIRPLLDFSMSKSLAPRYTNHSFADGPRTPTRPGRRHARQRTRAGPRNPRPRNARPRTPTRPGPRHARQRTRAGPRNPRPRNARPRTPTRPGPRHARQRTRAGPRNPRPRNARPRTPTRPGPRHARPRSPAIEGWAHAIAVHARRRPGHARKACPQYLPRVGDETHVYCKREYIVLCCVLLYSRENMLGILANCQRMRGISVCARNNMHCIPQRNCVLLHYLIFSREYELHPCRLTKTTLYFTIILREYAWYSRKIQSEDALRSLVFLCEFSREYACVLATRPRPRPTPMHTPTPIANLQRTLSIFEYSREHMHCTRANLQRIRCKLAKNT